MMHPSEFGIPAQLKEPADQSRIDFILRKKGVAVV